MASKISAIAIFLLFSTLLFAQTASVEISIIVSDDAGASQTLICGLDAEATDSLDQALGETELPPFPPAGAFEARFIGHDIGLPELGEGTYKDIRKGDVTFSESVRHELRYQVGEGEAIIIHWTLPPGISGHLSDLFNGAVISKDMHSADSLTITNPGAINKLILELYYTGIPSPPQLDSPAHESLNVASQPLLVWRKVKDAATYYLQLAANVDFSIMILSDSGIVDTSYQVSNLEAETTYFWRVQAQNDRGSSGWSDTWQFTVEAASRVGFQESGVPQDFELLQNVPNPFNPMTRIDYVVPHSSRVRIAVYGINGRHIKTLVSEIQNAGRYSVVWNGENHAGRSMPSGAFFVRLQADDIVRTKKMILMR